MTCSQASFRAPRNEADRPRSNLFSVSLASPVIFPTPMSLHLLVPDLFPPFLRQGEAPRLPALETLLARGRHGETADPDGEAWLCRAFGVADCPVAALTLLADGGEPGVGFWLRADPVHLELRRDGMALLQGGGLGISAEEAAALTAALNHHFARDGLTFHALRPERWYLHTATPPALETVPLSRVMHRYIGNSMPSGPDGPRWRAVLTEIQMVLHDHPVNAAREERGRHQVNSLWLWGGGPLAPVAPPPYGRVWADDPLAQGLAIAAGLPWAALPSSARELPKAGSPPAEVLVVLEALRRPAGNGDVSAWAEAARRLEQHWFAPLLSALKSATLGRLTLHAPDGDRTRVYTVERRDLWKFWRHRPALASYLRGRQLA
jgi:hypothetical protein